MKQAVAEATVEMRAVLQQVTDLGFFDEVEALPSALAWFPNRGADGFPSRPRTVPDLREYLHFARRLADAAGSGCLRDGVRMWEFQVEDGAFFLQGTEKGVLKELRTVLDAAKRVVAEDELSFDDGRWEDMASSVARVALYQDGRRPERDRRFRDMSGRQVSDYVSTRRTRGGFQAELRYPGGGAVRSDPGHPDEVRAVRQLFSLVKVHGLPA